MKITRRRLNSLIREQVESATADEVWLDVDDPGFPHHEYYARNEEGPPAGWKIRVKVKGEDITGELIDAEIYQTAFPDVESAKVELLRVISSPVNESKSLSDISKVTLLLVNT